MTEISSFPPHFAATRQQYSLDETIYRQKYDLGRREKIYSCSESDQARKVRKGGDIGLLITLVPKVL